ncbi:MAG TPA: rRNA maturation RNase YbeY, partial [bacterium]|nr:rRNA maturation RNase YbeY [bacterium]
MERLPRRIKITWQATDPALQRREEHLAHLLEAFLAGLGFPRSGVTLLLGDDAALQALNGRFRGLAAPTDILSWSYLTEGSQPELLGELAVSLERVQAQARENGWDPWTELARLLAHGCAHLAGYAHDAPAQDRVMREVEERLLAAAGI